MRKILFSILSIMLVLCLSIGIVGCKKDEQPVTSGSATHITLSSYEITIKEGEQYTLNVMKYDANGNALTVEQVSYFSDAEKVASVVNGTITGNQKGETYIHVIADGFEASCFVNVILPDRDGMFIDLTTNVLYKGLEIKAYANLYEMGKHLATLSDVTWSVSDSSYLTIDSDGNINPLAVGKGNKITAIATYNGKEYSAEITIDIVEPSYYEFSTTNVNVVTNKTLSGKENSKYTETFVTVDEVNALTGTRTNVTESCTVNVLDTSVATATLVGDKIKVTANTNSTTLMTANIYGNVIFTRITCYTPLAEIADLDELSLASINLSQISLLSGNYMLVNDIDYSGKIMYPIAPYIEKTTETSIGVQWKYILDVAKENGTNIYSFVNRTSVGQSGEGLTDDEFKYFIENKKISNAISFSGVLDGNGYAIKNASIMYDTGVSNSANSTHAVYSSIFGNLTGTIRNVAFTGIKQQDPSTCAYDITKLYYKETSNGVYKYDIGNISLTTKTESNKQNVSYSSYMARGCSLIGQATNATIDNVLLEIEFTLLHQQRNLYNGALVARGFEKTIISNCVVDVNDINSLYGNGYYSCGIQGGATSNLARYENNLAVGVFRIERGIGYDGGSKNRGVNGNWFVSVAEGSLWSNILKAKANTTLANFRTAEDTIATFDSSIWNIDSRLTERPSLKIGCSIKTI